MNPVPTPRIHIPLRIRVNSIREPHVTIRKHLSIVQAFSVVGDIEAVDGRRVREVVFVREGVGAGVGYVDVPGRKRDGLAGFLEMRQGIFGSW